MALRPGRKCQKYHSLAIRRWMREPIFSGVASNALGFGIVGASALSRKSPDVPSTGAIGVDVDPLSIGRIIGAVVEARARSQPFFLAAHGRNAIDVEIAAALTDKCKPPAIRRPSMKVARDIRSNHLRTGSIRVRYIYL